MHEVFDSNLLDTNFLQSTSLWMFMEKYVFKSSVPAEFKVVRFTLLSSVAWHSVPCTDELRASGRKSCWARGTELLTSGFITKMCYAQASGKKDKDLKFYSIVYEDTVKKAETDV